MTIVRKYLLVFGGVFFLLSAVQLVRFFGARADIWWTPKELAVTPTEATDRVELYVRGVALPEQIKAGRLQLVTDNIASPITEADVRVRLNNRDQIRVRRFPSVLISGIVLGAAAVLFLFGLMNWAPPRRTPAAE